MIISDAHTHIYPCYDLDTLVEAAFTNFGRIAAPEVSTTTAVMFLADSAQTDSFSQLAALGSKNRAGEPDTTRGWSVNVTSETTSLELTHRDYPDITLFIVAGFQVVTREKLEVLGVGLEASPPEGELLEKTVESILTENGLVILPWGVGKWLGNRKHCLETYVKTSDSSRVFVGDNGNRPTLWPEPALFAAGQAQGPRVLSGSDPLPLAGEERRVGSFGSIIHAALDHEVPTRSIISALADPHTRITPYGKLQPLTRFISQQVRIRML